MNREDTISAFEASPPLYPETHHTDPVCLRPSSLWPAWLHTVLPADTEWSPGATDPQHPARSAEMIIVASNTKHRAAAIMPELTLRLLVELGRYGGSLVVNPNSATKPNSRAYLRFKTADDLFTVARLITGAGEHEAVEQLRETTMLDLRPLALRMKGDGKAQKEAWPPILRAAIERAESRSATSPDGLLPSGVPVTSYKDNLVQLHTAVVTEYASYRGAGE